MSAPVQAAPGVANAGPSLTGAVVIVTGGARGVGASLAGRLLLAGARVVVADVTDQVDDAALRDSADVLVHRTDVADRESTKALAAATVERFGRIDALVNNAAIYQGLGGKKSFTDIDVDEWDRVMAVNARGVWLMTAAVYPQMKQQGYGRIVNIASATVHSGVPFFAHYTASKGAVIAITRSIAKEIGRDGISVNAVAPGLIDNESSATINDSSYFPVLAKQRAIPRSMVPDDLTGIVTFLCSPASGFISGQTIIVDGGTVFS
jgi:NAD(P)-dependent dehydrogenase (short-subunit alcohol dehydrogenase family)